MESEGGGVIDVNERDDDGDTALHRAVETAWNVGDSEAIFKESLQEVEALLATMGIDVDAANNNGLTPMSKALRYGRRFRRFRRVMALAERLVASGAGTQMRVRFCYNWPMERLLWDFFALLSTQRAMQYGSGPVEFIPGPVPTISYVPSGAAAFKNWVHLQEKNLFIPPLLVNELIEFAGFDSVTHKLRGICSVPRPSPSPSPNTPTSSTSKPIDVSNSREPSPNGLPGAITSETKPSPTTSFHYEVKFPEEQNKVSDKKIAILCRPRTRGGSQVWEVMRIDITDEDVEMEDVAEEKKDLPEGP